MKPSDPHRNLIAPIIQPNEARKRMRKLERALDSANEAVQIARDEYHYLMYERERERVGVNSC
uniref:Uncharacterized protein n=1 Tax=Candidatus Kentrum sp. TUN TaxID=2126343 RepID=A0A450ZXH3_9GAMM|nr:MAG: hypothetical protein BECKTUN1418F_GA0071002_11444 [Candidatus Kentron sp. TUN]VFK60306.1 MAG: hypothetical protein BECKTUN1418D_GA0071000_11204 [Candidatus Kentron sp. TUN]VFK67331.1 MAG: hypothetical protein BECKTUN1418E_GA0071001_11424 [Candidatus Kentron sp. TUN]